MVRKLLTEVPCETIKYEKTGYIHKWGFKAGLTYLTVKPQLQSIPVRKPEQVKSTPSLKSPEWCSLNSSMSIEIHHDCYAN